MDDPIEILRRAERVVLYDWPDRDVPDALALGGLDVIVSGGPALDDVFRSEVIDCKVVSRKIGVPPESADLVYVFRPLAELPRILDDAKRMSASTIWRQSGLDAAGHPIRVGAHQRPTPRNGGRRSRRQACNTSKTLTSATWCAG